MFGKKRGKDNNSNSNGENFTVESKGSKLETKDSDFFNKIQQEKKGLLPKDALTNEEIVKEIEKQIKKRGVSKDYNPYKTRADMYFTFYDSKMNIQRGGSVPFEEYKIGGKSYFVNKRFENGRIVIEELYANPEVEINLEEEFNRKEVTKSQLEKINKYILYINKKISEGEDKYNLIDIEDLKDERNRLKKILDSIKYGKSAEFVYEDPISRKRSFMLKYNNGEYRYLKTTENNYVVEENNIKFIKGYEIQKRLEEIANLRITRNWKEILLGALIFFITILCIMGIYKLMTFEETLFDERVKDYCRDNLQLYEDQLRDFENLKCSQEAIKKQQQTALNTEI